jgi:hypothetical protein
MPRTAHIRTIVLFFQENQNYTFIRVLLVYPQRRKIICKFDQTAAAMPDT